MSSSSKRAATAILCIGLAFTSITGCTVSRETAVQAAQSMETLYSTDTLKIEREGARTYVYDLAGNAAYTFAKKRVRKDPAAQYKEIAPAVDTDTIKIQTIGRGILVEDKTAGTTIYIP